MCGICGIVSLNKIKSEFIVKMNDTLKHRGPDDEGYLLYDLENAYFLTGSESQIQGEKIFDKQGNIFLGHRRLSIIDLSPLGAQPMSDMNNKIWIIFNGEIYNYLELRDLLEKKGYKFRTNTDTEVIINSYLEWGYDCVQNFDGMWAFVILDTTKNILFGSRDRFGVKPFYFYYTPNIFLFASEIKAIVKSDLYPKQINLQHVKDYLVFGYEEQYPLSFFKNIYPLKPSYNFIFNLKNFELKFFRYYELEFNNRYEKFDQEKFLKSCQKVKELIFEAVNLRLRSDVSIGSCLSGGLDSTTIVCTINEIMKKNFIENIGEKQKVFTAVFKGEDIDESKWAQIVVNKTKTQWFTTNPTFQELWQDIEDIVYYQDIPFGSTSIYAQYRVMKLAKENNVKVLLDGQGGDEVFTGYVLYYPVFTHE
ncbi:MAG: asparagine synthase (glutamine-hydrolyzing), partial [bacterium]